MSFRIEDNKAFGLRSKTISIKIEGLPNFNLNALLVYDDRYKKSKNI